MRRANSSLVKPMASKLWITATLKFHAVVINGRNSTAVFLHSAGHGSYMPSTKKLMKAVFSISRWLLSVCVMPKSKNHNILRWRELINSLNVTCRLLFGNKAAKTPRAVLIILVTCVVEVNFHVQDHTQGIANRNSPTSNLCDLRPMSNSINVSY